MTDQTALPLLHWSDEYTIGIASVDAEHRSLIDLINTLFAAYRSEEDRGGVGGFLGEMYARIAAHFALEERHMVDTRYSAYAVHKAEHEQLLDTLLELTDRFEEGGFSRHALADALGAWFTQHFKTHDARLHSHFDG